MSDAQSTIAAVPVLNWQGCYDDPWGDLIVPAAYQHPAKFALGLIRRIYAHGLEAGYWRKGDLVGDPFGGVALGGIVAAYHGLRWIGVELEEKFIALARDNISLHTFRLNNLGAPLPRIVQGDSRRFAEIVRQPFDAAHGEQPAGVVTSPPYAESCRGDNSEHETAAESRSKRRTGGGSLGQSCRHGGYGSDPANIGNLREGKIDAAVTSPPYVSGGHHPDQTGSWGGKLLKDGAGIRAGLGSKDSAGYGLTAGQIGQLPPGDADAVVTSPPWENQEPSHAQGSGFDPGRKGGGGFIEAEYGRAPGQIGNSAGQTYWQAMAEVYAQVLAAVKPGGVVAVVVKDYVKGGRRVRLCEQTLRLLAAVGFAPLEVARAHLVRESSTPTLFGPPAVRRKERKSFFRRLHESRLPEGSDCRIDWEEVLFVRKPPGPGGVSE